MQRGLKVLGVIAVMVGCSVLAALSAAPTQEPRDRDQELQGRLDRLEMQVRRLVERAGPGQDLRSPPPRPPELGRSAEEPSETRVLWPGHRAKAALWCTWRMAFVVMAVCHLLLAVWVFQDIRKRGEGSGLFIVLVLLAGFCGAILYALVRIGERKT